MVSMISSRNTTRKMPHNAKKSTTATELISTNSSVYWHGSQIIRSLFELLKMSTEKKFTNEETRISYNKSRVSKKHQQRLEWIAFATKQIFPKWDPDSIEAVFRGYITRPGFENFSQLQFDFKNLVKKK